MSNEPRIENWEVVHELSCYRLAGSVYGHPCFQKGELCHTSKLLRIDFENKTAQTISRTYILGKMRGER
jgi:hypothetical protein